MIQAKIKALVDKYCMGVNPSDDQMDEIMDLVAALGADPVKVTAYMREKISGPTREELEKAERERKAKAKAEAEKKARVEAAKKAKAESAKKAKAEEERKRREEEEKRAKERREAERIKEQKENRKRKILYALYLVLFTACIYSIIILSVYMIWGKFLGWWFWIVALILSLLLVSAKFSDIKEDKKFIFWISGITLIMLLMCVILRNHEKNKQLAAEPMRADVIATFSLEDNRLFIREDAVGANGWEEGDTITIWTNYRDSCLTDIKMAKPEDKSYEKNLRQLEKDKNGYFISIYWNLAEYKGTIPVKMQDIIKNNEIHFNQLRMNADDIPGLPDSVDVYTFNVCTE